MIMHPPSLLGLSLSKPSVLLQVSATRYGTVWSRTRLGVQLKQRPHSSAVLTAPRRFGLASERMLE